METLMSFLKKWWIALIVGIIALGLGIFFICSPGTATSLGSLIFVILFLVVGVLEFILTLINRKSIPAWGWNLVLSILIIGFSICFLTIPALKEITFVTFFAVGMIIESITCISRAIEFKSQGISGWGWILALGILAAIASIYLFVYPLLSFLVLEIIIAVNCIVFGIQMISTSIVMSKAASELKKDK